MFVKNEKVAQSLIRAFFDVIEHVKSEELLIQYCLAHLDGILEDSRERIKIFIDVENHFKTPGNLISILNSFIHRNNHQNKLQRDIASHVLALMIEADKFEKCEKEAKEFLYYLMQQRDITAMQLSH
jgi:tyrosyl-tRNA synthetase